MDEGPEATLPELLDRVRAGDEAAAVVVVRRYEQEVRRFIRFRMTSSSVRRFVDSLDICQSVLARFFQSLKHQNVEVDNSVQLRALLLQIAQNRIYDAVSFQHAAKRDARRLACDPEEWLGRIEQSQETAERFLEMQELAEIVYSHCDEADREFIHQRMCGVEWRELAAKAGMTEDALRKRVQRAIESAAQEAHLITHRRE